MRLASWLLAVVALGCGSDIRVNSNAGGADGANAVPGQSQVCTVELAVDVEGEDWTEVGLSVPYDRSVGRFALTGYEVECEARADALRLYASDESDASDPSLRRLVVFADGGGDLRKDTPEITCRLFAPATPPVDAFPDSNAMHMPVRGSWDEAQSRATVQVSRCRTLREEDLEQRRPAAPAGPPCSQGCESGTMCIRDACAVPTWFEVDLELASAQLLGALMFKVDYTNSGGEVVGPGITSHCSFHDSLGSTVFGALCNFIAPRWGCDLSPISHPEQLTVALASIEGFAGPQTLLTCAFVTAAGAVDPDALVVSVLDATTPSFEPAVDDTVVRIAGIREIAPPAEP